MSDKINKNESLTTNRTDQPTERLSDVDRMALDLAKSNKKLAVAQAEKALAQNETAEVSYKYVVLQLYMKYGLTAEDAITEAGDIIRGGAIESKG